LDAEEFAHFESQLPGNNKKKGNSLTILRYFRIFK
jgi:hypothetical protein